MDGWYIFSTAIFLLFLLFLMWFMFRSTSMSSKSMLDDYCSLSKSDRQRLSEMACQVNRSRNDEGGPRKKATAYLQAGTGKKKKRSRS